MSRDRKEQWTCCFGAEGSSGKMGRRHMSGIRIEGSAMRGQNGRRPSMRQRALVVIALALALCVMSLSACGGSTTASVAGDKIEVVCATFPAYDWTRRVVGGESDRFDITYLMGNGVDLHSFQPSVEDVAKIADADLFIYVGGESDQWPSDAVRAADNPNLHSLSLLEAVGDAAVEEEIVEGMKAEEEDEASDEKEYDEHVWLSLKNAQVLVNALADELAEIDAEHAEAYRTNAKAYVDELAKLDARYAEIIQKASHDTVVFADRFPFRYLTEDYGLSYYAAFAGCSAETEASFDTVTFLAKKLDELNVGAVLVLENSDQKIAQTVVQTSKDKNQKILTVDSLQSTEQSEVDAGKTYIDAMEANLSVIAEALS